ncbi:hypothetical protein BK126_26125 [Paenibacillus sp. FSL H7-0326]|uniref:hypothetical protein n=1 Tax=Paenibacillus sp. FSL H7-0326 TaxID=1921144 RepID=UPI00096E052A|nr:hypothetical protein [Paenibacillus sp. FSL H7-0326]OMC63674.1 hypothetical protein BK126_26125 [Paenibacillus sp. FSL H7-0326]
MRNQDVMKKVIDLDTQYLYSREQSLRVMVQIAIIRKAFGVKNDETNKPVIDYERELVLSDDEIRKEFDMYLSFLKWSIESKDVDKQREFKNQILHFIDAVRFFNENLAKEFLIDLPSAS